MIINLWSLAIFASAILSWVPNLDPYHPVVTAVRRIADLICDPIRRIVPTGSLGIDLSPLLAILLLHRLILLTRYRRSTNESVFVTGMHGS